MSFVYLIRESSSNLDLPAQIDYVLNATGVDGIYYIAHSMGTTAFWVLMSERPEYNSKIKLMSAFSPVAFTQHMISPIRLFTPYLNQIEVYIIILTYIKSLLESYFT